MHILQAQMCGCISAPSGLPHQRTKRVTSDALKGQLNKARWNRQVFKFGSGNQLNAHNYYLSIRFVDFYLIARSGKRSRYYQFDCVCAARLKYRSLVLKNVKIADIWIRKNYYWQKKKFRQMQLAACVSNHAIGKIIQLRRILIFVISLFGNPLALDARGRRPVCPPSARHCSGVRRRSSETWLKAWLYHSNFT